MLKPENYMKIQEVLLNYINGTYESDIPLLKSCFHENAKMTGYLGDTLVDGTPEPFFEDMASGPSMALRKDPLSGGNPVHTHYRAYRKRGCP